MLILHIIIYYTQIYKKQFYYLNIIKPIYLSVF